MEREHPCRVECSRQESQIAQAFPPKRFAGFCAQTAHFVGVLRDLSVKLGLIGVVKGERGMNLCHRELFIMLKEYFLGAPPMREMIERNFDDLSSCSREPRDSFVIYLDGCRNDG